MDGVQKTSLVQKLPCGVGNVVIDLYRGVSFSYTLIFLSKVAGLTGRQAGLVVLVSQLADSFTSPLIGYCSDKLSPPLIGRLIGRRKAWHLLGTILMTVCFSLKFTSCLFCPAGSSGWHNFAYYAVIAAVTNLAFPVIDISHLSIMAVVAKNQDECVTFNTLRTLFTYISGICSYAVTWAILGRDSKAGLTPDSWKDFTLISLILAGTGLFVSGVIFQLGTRVPEEINPPTKVKEAFTKVGLTSVGVIFTLGINMEEERDQYGCRNSESIEQRNRVVMRETYENEGFEEDSKNNSTLPRADNDGEEKQKEVTGNGPLSNGKKESCLPCKLVDACHVEGQETGQKSRRQWLKEPMLYMVGLVYALTRLMQDAGFAYMSFYLTDYLKLPMVAIAYFPLILLISGSLGSVLGKLLNAKVGSKWTYCVAAAAVIGAAAGFFFLSPETHASAAYALTILLGMGMSCCFVMALSLQTALIGESKRTAGFVFSLTSVMAKMASGTFFISVQSFYPSSGDEASFARHAFPLSLGLLAAFGLFFVLVSQKSTRAPGAANNPTASVQDRPSAVHKQTNTIEETDEGDTTWDTRL